MDARMAAQGLSRLADDGGGQLGQARHPARSISRTLIITPSPRRRPKLGSLDEVDPEILRVYEKLGIPIEEQKVLAGVEGARKVAVDAVFDSVSVATTFREELKRAGVIFLSISEAIREYPELVRKYLGSVVPQRDNYFACLNSAVFSDGTFVYVPEGVRCPMELSTYFRINAENTGQFERTLIVADKGSYVSYLEGCTAPMRDENQLHAAVVELVRARRCRDQIFDRPELVSGRRRGQGRHLQFRHQAGDVRRRALQGLAGPRSRPARRSPGNIRPASCKGEGSVGEFYSVAVTNNRQQADTGTKMIHIGARQPLDHRLQGDQRRQIEQHLSRPRPGQWRRRERPQLHPVRFPAARRQMRRPHRPLYRGPQPDRPDRA